MTRTALTNARVLLPSGLRDDVCVVIGDGEICAISSASPQDARIVDLGGRLLLPGFIDTQVNGGGGRLFNDDPSVETIRVIAETHRRYGTTGLLPTLISDDLSVVDAGIRADAVEQRSHCRRGRAGRKVPRCAGAVLVAGDGGPAGEGTVGEGAYGRRALQRDPF